jgi:hypothetical protein
MDLAILMSEEAKGVFWFLLKNRLSTDALLKRKVMDLPSFDLCLMHPLARGDLRPSFLTLSFFQK